MWFRFTNDFGLGIPRIKQYQVCFYDMDAGGGCFDEAFFPPEDIGGVITFVETVEDVGRCDRIRVFAHFDDGDVYEIKLNKLSKEEYRMANKFDGGNKNGCK